MSRDQRLLVGTLIADYLRRAVPRASASPRLGILRNEGQLLARTNPPSAPDDCRRL